jgi:hypothetical protein
VAVRVQTTVLSVEGSAAIVRGSDTAAHPLAVGFHPRAGDSIWTEAASHTSLALLPNALATLEPHTQIKLGTLSLAKDGNETGDDAMLRRNAHLQLDGGAMFVLQERRDVQAEPALVIETAHGMLVSSFDCLLRIESSDTETRVLCVTGTIEYRPKNAAPVQIEPGYVGQWSKDTGAMFAADTDAGAQTEISMALDVEGKLRALRSKLGDVLPR